MASGERRVLRTLFAGLLLIFSKAISASCSKVLSWVKNKTEILSFFGSDPFLNIRGPRAIVHLSSVAPGDRGLTVRP